MAIESTTIITLYDDAAKTKAFAPRTKVEAISNNSGTGLQALLDGKMSSKPTFIEFGASADNTTNEGYIDWHWNGSSADYTSRLIESASGTLSVNGVTFNNSKITSGTWNGSAIGVTYGGTGGTTAKTARDNLEITRLYCGMVPYGTSIPSNANLNTATYMKVGNYFCSANATAQTLTNAPTTEAFMMQVYSPLSTTIDNESGTWVYRLRKYTTYTGHEYIQYCYTNGTAGNWTYGPWMKIAKTSDITLSTLGITATAAELNYVDGVTSNIQTQLNGKSNTSHNHDSVYVNVGGDTMTGALTIKGETTASVAYGSVGPKIRFFNTDGSQNADLIFSDYDSYQGPASLTLIGNQGGEYLISPNLKATTGAYKGTSPIPAVFISSSTPTAKQTGDIWFVT